MDDDDCRTSAASARTIPAVSASSSSRSGGIHRAPHRPGHRGAPVVACLVGALVLLAGLGAAGPPAPVTAAEVLPPPDTSATGATGRLPDPVPVPLPIPPGAPPLEGAPIPDEPTLGGSALGIPETVLAAYRAAATTVDRAAPGCRLTWPLVAGIGKVESGHASGGAVDADGTTRRPILGPQLTGTDGNAAIPDTDGGALDHDAMWDRAVGPTQFIPSSWRIYGADGNGDGRADPDNVFDAGLATARYLCSSGGDLSGSGARHDAVFRYNHSEDYVATVLRWADAYASGALPVLDSTGTGDGDDGLADGGIVDGAPTLAALPSPSSRVPTAGRVAAPSAGSPVALPSPPGSVITSSGATRPGVAATRSPSSDLAPAAVSPVPSTSPAVPIAPRASTPRPAAAATSTSITSTSTSATSTSSPASPLPATSIASGPAPKPAPPSTTAPAKPAPPKPSPPKPSPPKPPPSTSTSSTTTSSTTTSPAAPAAAARCTAALSAVARVTGLPAAQLSAASDAGPGTGRTTCTVRGPRGPLLVAVTAAPGAPAPSMPATGVSRTVAGGRTVLTVPAVSGLPDDRARAALAAVAAGWG